MNKKIEKILEDHSIHLKKENKKYPTDVNRVLKYLNNHLFDQEINNDKIFSDCNISNKNFSGKFCYYSGFTPKQYILEQRIECAKKILETYSGSKNQDIKIIELAMFLGFSTHSAFTSLFKKKTGTPPPLNG